MEGSVQVRRKIPIWIYEGNRTLMLKATKTSKNKRKLQTILIYKSQCTNSDENIIPLKEKVQRDQCSPLKN